MTTIAWDGTTLAADRQTTWGGTPTRTRKLFRAKASDGRVFIGGCSGLHHECEAVRRWLQGGHEPGRLDEVCTMLIDRHRRVWIMNERKLWAPVGRHPWAIGSGSDYALGALEHGATAREAVLIATRLDVNTGKGVDWMRFA